MIRNMLVWALVGLLAACGMTATKKASNLDLSIDNYIAALRWTRTDDARSFHMDRDRTRPGIDTSAMEDIRVTGYTIRKKVLNEEVTEATVRADLDYYHNEYGTLKQTTIVLDWWYDEESKRWFIESDFPTFE